MNGTTMQATEGAALQADWRSLCAQHTAYVDLPASPGKCLAAMQLIGAGYKFLVDHWCEIGFLIEGENSGQPVCELCPRTCEVDAETAEAAGWTQTWDGWLCPKCKEGPWPDG